MARTKADIILDRLDSIAHEDERVNSENMWRELTEFILNNQHGMFIGHGSVSTTDIGNSGSSIAPGSKRTRNVFDSTAIQANQDLAASFQGTVTNPATQWSKLRFNSERLNDDKESSMWLEDVNRLIHNFINESNFDTESGKAYQSFTSLGNMALFHEMKETPEGNFDGFRFTSLHLGQIYWKENKDGIIDTLYRKFDMSARNLVEKFGAENMSENILKAITEENEDKTFQMVHCIVPRDKKDIQLNEIGLAPGDKRPFASIYIEVESRMIVEESGYYEFPVYVPRWSLMPGEEYGRGPGHIGLPDIKTLNRLIQRNLEAIDLQVRPPIFANQRDVFGQLDMRPGQISIVKDHNGVREFVSQARSDIMQLTKEELRNGIRAMFFLDKLLLPPRTETGEMTAFEIAERTEQMHRVLGPVMARLNTEFLSPLIVRCFRILLRAGVLPEVPSLVREAGIDIEIVFVNALARAQQSQDVSTIQQVVQQMLIIAQADPTVVDNFNSDEALRHGAKVVGAPEVLLRGRDEVEQIRQQRAQQQAQQAQLEQANLLADTAAKAGNLGGPNGQE